MQVNFTLMICSNGGWDRTGLHSHRSPQRAVHSSPWACCRSHHPAPSSCASGTSGKALSGSAGQAPDPAHVGAKSRDPRACSVCHSPAPSTRDVPIGTEREAHAKPGWYRKGRCSCRLPQYIAGRRVCKQKGHLAVPYTMLTCSAAISGTREMGRKDGTLATRKVSNVRPSCLPLPCAAYRSLRRCEPAGIGNNEAIPLRPLGLLFPSGSSGKPSNLSRPGFGLSPSPELYRLAAQYSVQLGNVCVVERNLLLFAVLRQVAHFTI